MGGWGLISESIQHVGPLDEEQNLELGDLEILIQKCSFFSNVYGVTFMGLNRRWDHEVLPCGKIFGYILPPLSDLSNDKNGKIVYY